MKRNPRRAYEIALMPLSAMREHGVRSVGAICGRPVLGGLRVTVCHVGCIAA